MELEEMMRAAFVLREPASDFEDVVIARLAASTGRASHSARRRQPQWLLAVAVLTVAAAAAILMVQQSGDSRSAATLATTPVEAAASAILQQAPPVNASVQPVSSPLAALPPTVPTSADVSQLCDAAAKEPPVAVAFTVLVEPLRVEVEDLAVQAQMQDYYNGALEQLRKFPGLGLLDVAAAGAKPADYRVSIRARSESDSAGPPNLKDQVEFALEAWKGNAFKSDSWSRGALEMNPRICAVAGNRSCSWQAGSQAALFVSSNRFPKLASSAQKACEQARREVIRQQMEEQRQRDPTPFVAPIRQTLERIASAPGPLMRVSAWSSLQAYLRPDLIQPLVMALGESKDDAFRRELVTLLAVTFPDDAAARSALTTVAVSSADTFMRHVAERVVSGEAPWRDYALARLRDTSLTAAQRLEPLEWMAESMTLNKPMLAAELGGVLTALQSGNGIALLAEFVAGTQQVGQAGFGALTEQGALTQQGQLTMRQIASVNHPAVPELLIAYYDAAPNSLTLGVLATRRDEPRVVSKLESIAAADANEQLRRSATNYLRQPVNQQRPEPPRN